MKAGLPALALALVCGGCRTAHNEPTAAIERTMAEARTALREHGATSAALQRIQRTLADLAEIPGLRHVAELRTLHGNAGMRAGKLASDGDSTLSLFIVHFAANSTTPVHDHLTWGVLHVLEGRDVYVPWQRLDDARDPHRAELRPKPELQLGPGQSTYWLPPPHDLHSQRIGSEDVWELVMTGKNVMSEGVTQHRHYYDPATGRISNVNR